ncbi:unnamed protein product [Sphenostylis stenocarpa]|uniref:Uncharacterized protein n=1 Tax=Sphenostylis stenocarpa TaxID=92480 RepID=A0AA86SYP9_9FABA|nr:unnamed protein product [Sphenostylis stenocarpa]
MAHNLLEDIFVNFKKPFLEALSSCRVFTLSSNIFHLLLVLFKTMLKINIIQRHYHYINTTKSNCE